MTNEVIWTKLVLERFIQLANLTEEEEIVIRTRAVSMFSRCPKISTAEESAGGSTPENWQGKNPDGHWSV